MNRGSGISAIRPSSWPMGHTKGHVLKQHLHCMELLLRERIFFQVASTAADGCKGSTSVSQTSLCTAYETRSIRVLGGDCGYACLGLLWISMSGGIVGMHVWRDCGYPCMGDCAVFFVFLSSIIYLAIYVPKITLSLV